MAINPYGLLTQDNQQQGGPTVLPGLAQQMQPQATPVESGGGMFDGLANMSPQAMAAMMAGLSMIGSNKRIGPALAQAAPTALATMNMQSKLLSDKEEKERRNKLTTLLQGKLQGTPYEGLEAYMSAGDAMKAISGQGLPQTDDIKEFEYALKNGYKGTFQDWQTKNRPQTIIENNMNTGELSPGWKSIDQTFGKEHYTPFITGGSSDTLKQLSQLETVMTDIEAGKQVSGPGVAATGLLGDTVQAVLNPDAVDAKERVAEVTQRNLRAILGGQFAKQEGEQLISRTFNPALSPAQNARRVRTLMEQIKTAYEQKKAAVDYFQRHGTLRGYTGTLPDADVFRSLFRDYDPEKQTQPDMNNVPPEDKGFFSELFGG